MCSFYKLGHVPLQGARRSIRQFHQQLIWSEHRAMCSVAYIEPCTLGAEEGTMTSGGGLLPAAWRCRHVTCTLAKLTSPRMTASLPAPHGGHEQGSWENQFTLAPTPVPPPPGSVTGRSSFLCASVPLPVTWGSWHLPLGVTGSLEWMNTWKDSARCLAHTSLSKNLLFLLLFMWLPPGGSSSEMLGKKQNTGRWEGRFLSFPYDLFFDTLHGDIWQFSMQVSSRRQCDSSPDPCSRLSIRKPLADRDTHLRASLRLGSASWMLRV